MPVESEVGDVSVEAGEDLGHDPKAVVEGVVDRGLVERQVLKEYSGFGIFNGR